MYHFNGTNNKVIFGAASFLPTGDASRSVFLRYKPGVIAGEKSTASWGTNANNQMFALTSLSASASNFSVWGYSHDIHGNIPLALNRWHDIAVTYDATSGTLKMWINGVQAINIVTTDYNTNAAGLLQYFYDASLGYGKGDLWDVRIFNRAITWAEYNAIRGYEFEFAPAATLVVPQASNWAKYAADKIWLTSYVGGSLARIDPIGKTVEDTLAIGAVVAGVDYDGSHVGIAVYGANDVRMVNPSTLAIEHTIAGLTTPHGLVWDGNNWWVSEYTTNVVKKIDPATWTVTATIGVGAGPAAMYVINNFLYVFNLDGTTITKISLATETVVGTITGLSGPGQMVIAFGSWWVTNYTNYTLAKIDPATETVIDTFGGFIKPWGLAADDYYLWIMGEASDLIHIFDPVAGEIIGGTVAYDTQGPLVAAENHVWVTSVTTDMWAFPFFTKQYRDPNTITDGMVFATWCGEMSGITCYDRISNNNGTLNGTLTGFFLDNPTYYPNWSSGYPSLNSVSKTTIDILVKLDRPCTAYWVCLERNASTPTPAQVKAGQDADGQNLASGLFGNVSVIAETIGNILISGLETYHNYSIFIVAETTGGNIQPDVDIIYASTLISNADYLKRSLLQVESIVEFKLNLGTALDIAEDISKYVINLSDLTEKLSKSSFNSGGVLLPSLNIKLDNRNGRFNYDSGYFKNGFINGSSITITTHYIDPDGTEITSEFVFTGLIKYVSCEWDRITHIFETTLIPPSSLLATEKIQPGILSNDSFKNIIYKFLHRQPFTKYLDINLANLNLGWDVAITDSITEMVNKTVKEVLDEIMLLTGSVYYVNYDQEFIIEPIISASPVVICTFRGDDIQKITSEKYDWKGQFTVIKWDDGTNTIQRAEMSYTDRETYQYDFVELELKSKAITNSTNRTTIMANLLSIYKFLKREVVLVCKWNPDVLVNSYISLDVPEETIIADEFLIWNKDQWNDGKYWGIESPGISFDSNNFWRVVEIKRDVEGQNMQLTLIQQYSDDEI